MPEKSSESCDGTHFCPVCRQVKACGFGACAVKGEVKCDSCLYVETYGAQAGKIIEKAISVAAILDDATERLSQASLGLKSAPWKDEEDIRIWLLQAADAMEELDEAINILHLRLKARFSG